MELKYDKEKVLRFDIFTDDGYYTYSVWCDVVEAVNEFVLGNGHWTVMNVAIEAEMR